MHLHYGILFNYIKIYKIVFCDTMQVFERGNEKYQMD